MAASGTPPGSELAAKHEKFDEQHHRSEILTAKNKHGKEWKCVRVHHHKGMEGKEAEHEDEKDAKEKEEGEHGKYSKHGKLYRCYPAQMESDGHKEDEEEGKKIGVTKLGPETVLDPSLTTSNPTQTNPATSTPTQTGPAISTPTITNTAASDPAQTISAAPGPTMTNPAAPSHTRRRDVSSMAARRNIQMLQKSKREEGCERHHEHYSRYPGYEVGHEEVGCERHHECYSEYPGYEVGLEEEGRRHHHEKWAGESHF